MYIVVWLLFFFSSRRRHTRYIGDWSSDVCSSDLLWRVAQSAARGSNSPMTPYYTIMKLAEVGRKEEFILMVPFTPARKDRSEERRVGKECRWRVAAEYVKKKTNDGLE